MIFAALALAVFLAGCWVGPRWSWLRWWASWTFHRLAGHHGPRFAPLPR